MIYNDSHRKNFVDELFPDPLAHCRVAFLVEPTEALDLSNNPFFLALLCEYSAKAPVIRCTPECEVEELCGTAGQHEEEHNLHAQQAEVQ